MTAKYFNYIGKAQHAEQMAVPFHLLPYHLLDVAAVGFQALRLKPELADDLADLLEISAEELKALLVFGLLLHDLGKMTASFQSLFEAAGHTRIPLPTGVIYDAGKARHDQLGYEVWRRLALPDFLVLQNSRRGKRQLKFFLGIFWGHHGKPIRTEKVVHDSLRVTEEDIEAASQWVKDSWLLLDDKLSLEPFLTKEFAYRLKRASWLLAGFSTYCDWVGSDSKVFTYRNDQTDLKTYWETQALPKALEAISKTEVFDPVQVRPYAGFTSLFSFQPSPLQAYAETIPVSNSPQLFILEDLTGAGKTEAALVLTHRLLEARAGKGFYFGLPTMATSNAMFERVGAHYSKILATADDDQPSIVLAHGGRDLNERFRQARLGKSARDLPYQPDEHTASLSCAAWLADSRKKALLAPVGVGTVDQVLLSVLPKKHQCLRVLGLYGKVLVLDEVHAADAYMLELLETLLTLHASQGGSAILLTATLPLIRRKKLVGIWQKALGMTPTALQRTEFQDFPLATAVSLEGGLQETKIAVRAGTERQVLIDFVQAEEDCLSLIVEAVANGQCVVWVRNSIDEAIAAFHKIRDSLESPAHCLLFHSRFALRHRQDKEAWVMKHFGPHSGPEQRKGRVLVATQVFQESLDADADLMISDLCLIDDLVQRAGRLQRHRRDKSGKRRDTGADGRPQARLIVHGPPWQAQPDKDWLKRHSPNTQYVYQSPGRLWLTQDYLRRQGVLELPAQARAMIEHVYSPEAQVPAALEQAEQEYLGVERASSNQGRINRLDLDRGYALDSSQIWTDDKTEVGTRLGEEVYEVVLVRRVGDHYQPLIDDPVFGVDLSTLRISNAKLLQQLQVIDEDARAAFIERFPRAGYSLIADVDLCGLEYCQEYGLKVPA